MFIDKTIHGCLRHTGKDGKWDKIWKPEVGFPYAARQTEAQTNPRRKIPALAALFL
jgi:hypothetical protein